MSTKYQKSLAIVTITDTTGWEQRAILSIAKQTYFKYIQSYQWYILSPEINQKMLAFQHLCGEGKAQRITTIGLGDKFSFRTAMAKVIELTDKSVYTLFHYDVSKELAPPTLRRMVVKRKDKYSSGITYAEDTINLQSTAVYSRAFMAKICAESASDKELLKRIAKHKYIETGVLTT